MNKLGLVFALAIFSQGVNADKSSFANLTVLVAESAASSTWISDEQLTAEQKAVVQLEKHVEDVNDKLAQQREQRFAELLKASTDQ